MVQTWRREGRPVFLFGPLLNDAKQMEEYHSWGVDLCLTDRPDQLRALMDGTLGAPDVHTHKWDGTSVYFAEPTSSK